MPVYKLYYFDARGKAEHIRQLFALAGIQFEDIRITAETWPQQKDDMPLGQVPVLEVDGVKIGESVAIARFLGREFKLEGKSSLDNAILDMIGDVIANAFNVDGIKQWPYVLNGIIKEDKQEYFKNKVLPALDLFAPNVEKYLLRNNNGLLVGEQETWVDVYVAEFFSKFIDYGEKNCLDAYPHILELIARIHSIPSIRKYIEARKPTLC
ncbi:unnamed protein product [Enterobius vermicularis]|uniref:Glutathione transferase n=1 Tax=Enterobius vermicularis TaxID=51028 RepID=A0A0N4VCJ3_ENTVE|nr:unnamed protein product [Enterobius vermicularis]